MTAPTRTLCERHKVQTEFGSMYVSIDTDIHGVPVGGEIHTPRKEPDSQITRLVETLSEALDGTLAAIGERYRDG